MSLAGVGQHWRQKGSGRFSCEKHSQTSQRQPMRTLALVGCQRSIRPARSPTYLIAFVTRFQLMSNGENQNGIFVWYPPIFGHVAEPAAREYQLQATVLGFPAEQRMVGQQLERSPDADQPLTCELRVVFCEEIEKSLEIGERTSRYLDARHARARGRRADFPDIRASR